MLAHFTLDEIPALLALLAAGVLAGIGFVVGLVRRGS